MALPLEGIRVIETASAYAGPMAGRLLADWGADVVHVERAVQGDIARTQRAPTAGKAIDYNWENLNRNKRSLTLNLSGQTGRRIIHRLVESADVFLSNFRPREIEKFELGYATLSALNPRLVCANMFSFGRNGPDRDLPGVESTSLFSRAGVLYTQQVPGTPPTPILNGFGDHISGMALAYGIMLALFMREKTGVGQEVDVSLFQTGVFALSYYLAGTLVGGEVRLPADRRNFTHALLNDYETKDGRWIHFALSRPDPYWSRFCEAIGRPDLENDPRFASFAPRIQNNGALFDILEETFRARTVEEWRVPLNKAGLVWGVVQNLPEVAKDPQARANGFFVPFDHPTYGPIEVVANPVTLGKADKAVRIPAPECGQHTEEVLLECGYTWEDIGSFREQGAIS